MMVSSCLTKVSQDGNPRKLLDSEILKNLEWSPRYDLRRGLRVNVRVEHLKSP